MRRPTHRGAWVLPAIFLGGLIAATIAFALASAGATANAPSVEVRRVPDGGIQPQTILGNDGTIHLVYFKGDPAAGDLYYERSKDGVRFSAPLKVNSVAGTAVALGNIRGARIAIGRNGRVYVAWNGSKAASANLQRSPMLFTRMNDAGTGFEPERNLIHSAYGVDGGGGIAADQRGNVYVLWHAPILGKQGEANRRVWIARSEDDGKTFSTERVAWDKPVGACGCCSLDAFADSAGTLYVLFRSAQEMVHRDMYLLESKDHGATFAGSDISKWNVGYCVMSAEAFAAGRSGTFAAWETEKRVHLASIGDGAKVTDDTTVSLSGVNEKYPSLAVNGNGLVLMSWTEGMGWKRGGSVHWQIFDGAGHRVGQGGAANGVPAWSLVAGYPLRNGNFVLFY